MANCFPTRKRMHSFPSFGKKLLSLYSVQKNTSFILKMSQAPVHAGTYLPIIDILKLLHEEMFLWGASSLRCALPTPSLLLSSNPSLQKHFDDHSIIDPRQDRNPQNDVLVLTTIETLERGLLAIEYDQRQIDRVKMKKNVSRFRSYYMSHPRVYADLFYRLQATGTLDCSILGEEKTVNYFFIAIYLLAEYPTEEKAETAFSFDVCGRTFRDHGWSMVEKIASLHLEIIIWPTWWGNPDNPGGKETRFILTVDGTYCLIEEPTRATFAEQRKFYSHKFKTAGLDYEVALSIFEPKCVWIAGPYPAGKNDISIFRKKLKQKMLDSHAASGVQYRGLADRGYRGEANLLSIPNSQDTKEVREFKGRALSRQETFNARLKHFNCLDERFRHGIEKHASCFYACAVIVQLQMENGFPLFQV